MCAMIQRPFGLEYALLGFLEQEPQHGYQLHQRISDLSQLGLIWRVKQSQLYALLVKLEKSGYISCSLSSQETNPPRKIFILTEKGRIAYHAWLTSPVTRPRQIRQEFIAKLYFSLREGKAGVISLIEQQRKTCLEWLKKMEQVSQTDGENHLFSTIVYQYRSGQVKAIIKWLDNITADIVTKI
jgi:DNA-binding PadR family transcriptional regulator